LLTIYFLPVVNDFCRPSRSMKKISASFYLFLFTCLSTYAQTGTLHGTVIDKSTNLPIEFATISVYHAVDSSLADATSTKRNGKFSLQLKEGSYFLKTSFIGYPTLFQNASIKVSEVLDLGSIVLAPAQQMMDEIKVSATKGNVYNKIDKQVYKAGMFQSAQGGTAVDVIKNMPSVTVNGEGEISMRGSAGFQVLINGKPVQTDAQTILSQLPANTIENIELITSPSAKYDPDGKGGIINITTKKGVSEGFSLAINAQGGLPALHLYHNKEKPKRFGGDATLNFKKGKWDITASGNYLRNDLAGYREGNVNTTIGSTFTSFPSMGERSFDKYNYGGRLSVSFTPDKQNSFTAGIYKSKKFQARRADLLYHNSKTDINTGEKMSDFSYFNSNLQTKQGDFILSNFDFTHSFQNKSVLTASFLYEYAGLYGNTKNLNLSYPHVTDTLQYTYNPNTNPLRGYRANVDYGIAIGTGKLETGYQLRFDKQDGDFSYLTWDQQNAQFIYDPAFSSGVHSKNTIHSFFTQYSGRYENLNYSGGLRYEYAERQLAFSKQPDTHVLNLSNLFPSANLLYTMNNRWKLKAGYSRRVQRAKNYELNPYPEREHSETLEQGDANLLPEFIDLTELGVIKDFTAGSLFATLYHQQIKNPIQRVNKVYNDTILNRLFTNAGKARLWGMELGASYKLFKWWQLYAGANIYTYSIDGNIFNNSIAITNSSWVYSFNANSNFQLSPTWSYQFNLNYISNRPTAQGEDSRFLSPNSSLKKTLMNGRLSAMLQWQNMDAGLLKTNEQRITTRGSNFFTTTNYIYETDVLLLNISFNLNQLTKKIKLPTSEFGEKEF
jgi:ferric enterobactin receptor